MNLAAKAIVVSLRASQVMQSGTASCRPRKQTTSENRGDKRVVKPKHSPKASERNVFHRWEYS